MDYVEGIFDRLEEERYFTAAFYLKELSESGLIQELFERALQESEEEDDPWWQVRALEELERFDDARELMLANEQVILKSQDGLLFQQLLALAKGDREEWLMVRKEVARSGALQAAICLELRKDGSRFDLWPCLENREADRFLGWAASFLLKRFPAYRLARQAHPRGIPWQRTSIRSTNRIASRWRRRCASAWSSPGPCCASARSCPTRTRSIAR